MLELEHRTASVSDVAALARAFEGARVVLNAAGPFSQTPSRCDACLRTGAHYLDLTAEVPVIERLIRVRRDRARPPPDGHAGGRVRCRGDRLPRGARGPSPARGTPPGARRHQPVLPLTRVREDAVRGRRSGLVRREGALVKLPLGSRERTFDYGDGPRASINHVSLAD